MSGVSIVVPAYNAEDTLEECLKSIIDLERTCPVEIILVNDGSTDKTAEMAASFPEIKTINMPHLGAARATNLGIKTAINDVIALVEADVILEKDWLNIIIPALDDPSVAAAGGCVVTANSSIIGKIAGYDVELRLAKAPADIDHSPMTNTAYRRRLLLDIGLLNEDLKASYDVDLSRRLKAAGYRLKLVHEIWCRHYWKDNLRDYLRQQYNYAYYRLILAWKFGFGRAHDRITGPEMILQLPFAVLVLLFAVFGSLVFRWAPLTLFLLPLIHVPETVVLLYRKKDFAVLLLPLLFTVRNLCWVWAAIVWGVKSLTGSASPTGPQPDSGSTRE